MATDIPFIEIRDTSQLRLYDQILSRKIPVPDGYSYDYKQWHAFIQTHQKDLNFTDKIETAAHLMEGFSNGIRWVSEKYQSVSVRPPAMPLVVFQTLVRLHPPAVPKDGKSILFPVSFLKELTAQEDINRLVIFADEHGGKHPSSALEQATLAGVEECSHAALLQLQTNHSPSDLPVAYRLETAAHDAVEEEYVALWLQLDYAVTHHFHQETIDDLKNRIDAAYKYRHSDPGSEEV